VLAALLDDIVEALRVVMDVGAGDDACDVSHTKGSL
jgi:hypothetical protein